MVIKVVYITDETIEKFIKEDIPYIDLTTLVLGIDKELSTIQFKSRETAIISGTEEVMRIFQKFNIETEYFLPSGSKVQPGEVFLKAKGNADAIHMGWKVSLNILEYCSGIATRTNNLVTLAKEINENMEIVTTRKIFPGTKELSIKSVIAGGGYPHRLGLSETILIFKQHLNILGGLDEFIKNLISIKAKALEKKILVEVDNLDDALKVANAGVDGIQFDKLPPEKLKIIVQEIRKISDKITLIGTGGINESNIKEYAKTGVDTISTTSVYFGKPVDIGVEIMKGE